MAIYKHIHAAVWSAFGASLLCQSALAAPANSLDGVWRITRPCDGATSAHFDRCRNNDAYLVTTQLALQREGDVICGEVDQIQSPLRSAGGFVWGKVYGDTAHVYFTNSGWTEGDEAPGEATLRLRDGKLDWRVTREAAGKWSVDSAFGLAPLPKSRYKLDVWCPSELGADLSNGLIEKAIEVKWLRYPKIPKRAAPKSAPSPSARALEPKRKGTQQ